MQPTAARDAEVPQLYREHWLGLVRLALLMVGDRASAEDVVQDAFAKLYDRWDKLRDPSRAVTYLRSSVLNGSHSVQRRRRVALRRTQHASAMWSPEYDAIVGEEHRAVLTALQRLPTRRREVLVLRFFAELGDADIAATLGISEGTVRSAASRGLNALRQLLEETNDPAQE